MEIQKKVIGITSFHAEDRHLSPSNTCDCHVLGEMIAGKCLYWGMHANYWSRIGYIWHSSGASKAIKFLAPLTPFWMWCMQCGAECNILPLTQVLTPYLCVACHMVWVTVIHFLCWHATYRLHVVCLLKTARTGRLSFVKVLLSSVNMSLK
jgi:hypothetical protein